MGETKKNTILIVDDEQMVIQALVEILNPEYTVFVARNGQEAIIQSEKLVPDVIILDVIMPDIDGYDVISILKSKEKLKDIPVIFITGLDESYSEEKALKLGAADYIPKPLNPGIVKLRVQNQIRIIERYAVERNLNVVLKLQSDLVEAKENAEHANRAKSEFLSRMSHEMLTPMNAIMGVIQLIKKNPDKAKDYYEKLDTISVQLNNLINDVLDISNTEYGITRLEEAKFSFKAMLDAVIKDINRYSDVKQQKITSNIHHNIPDYLSGDEKRLKQLISCILSNAVKFTPELGEIHAQAHVADEENGLYTIQFEISDNGIGIPKEQQKRIFELFEQADGSISRKHGGIGIGLALSKRIVVLMGGTIWVESEPDEGAVFKFTCKLKKAD